MKTKTFVPCCTPITKESYNKMLPFLESSYICEYNPKVYIHLSNNYEDTLLFIGCTEEDNEVSNFQFLINSGVELTLQDIYIEVNDENRKEVIEFINETCKIGVESDDNTILKTDCSVYISIRNETYYICTVSGKLERIQATIQEVKEYFSILTLENIQVDCSELTSEQIENMKRVVVENGFKLWDYECAFSLNEEDYFFRMSNNDNDFLIYSEEESRTTITYDKFMELFDTKKGQSLTLEIKLEMSDELKELSEKVNELANSRKSYPKELREKKPTLQSVEVFNPQPHYDNSKGSLYKVGTERNWNPYLFDIVKRLERGGKKDPLKQEIEKSIDVLKIWLNELQ